MPPIPSTTTTSEAGYDPRRLGETLFENILTRAESDVEGREYDKRVGQNASLTLKNNNYNLFYRGIRLCGSQDTFWCYLGFSVKTV